MTIHRGAGRLHGFAIVAPAVGLAMGGTLVSGLVARPATFALGPAAPQDDPVGYNQALDSAAGARERRSDLPEAAGLRHLRQPCSVNTQAVFRAARWPASWVSNIDLCREASYAIAMTDWLPLLGFAIATSVTPGPNVLMVAAGAASHGVRGVLPHMLGITVGFGAMLLLVGLGLAGPLAASAWLHEGMRWAGAAWLLWLAWKIASAPPPGEGPRRPPMGFRGAALFQWVNPKAWMIAAAVTPAFTRPGEPLLPQVMAIAFVFVAISMPCLLVWAGIGAGAGRVLRSPGRLRAFNILMALLLVASLVPMLR